MAVRSLIVIAPFLSSFFFSSWNAGHSSAGMVLVFLATIRRLAFHFTIFFGFDSSGQVCGGGGFYSALIDCR